MGEVHGLDDLVLLLAEDRPTTGAERERRCDDQAEYQPATKPTV
jgi:hypothetical protein